MTVKLDKDLYLEKPTKVEKEKVKEQLLYGAGDSLAEVKKKKQEYEDKQLNEKV